MKYCNFKYIYTPFSIFKVGLLFQVKEICKNKTIGLFKFVT